MNKSEESESRSVNEIQQEEESVQQPQQVLEFVVPNGVKLKACIKCGLLKTEDQWSMTRGCENCGPFHDWKEAITDKYDNIATLINPDASWIRKKLRIKVGNKIVAGAYAMNIN